MIQIRACILREWWLASLAALLLAGCSTAASLSDVRFTLPQISHAVEATLSMGISERQDQGRTIISKPFKVQLAPQEKTDQEFRERGLARVYILGLEQPYKIEAEVDIERAYYDPDLKKAEQKRTLVYSKDRTDKRLAQKIIDGIRDYLYNRERNKNLIDDFRPF